MVSLPRFDAGLTLALFVLTAGCLGVLTGSEPLELESNPVSVTSTAQSDAGYEEVRTTTQTIEREFSAAGQTREAVVTNHVAEYARSVSVEPLGSGDLARFIVVSTPAVEILGQTFNPVGAMTTRELVELVQDRYAGLEDVEEAGERTATVLGESVTVSEFTGKAEIATSDQRVDVTIHVVRVRSGPDFIVAIGAHPTALGGEADRIDTMLRGIDHASG